MNQRNFTYAEAESCYYEEERISTGSTSEYSSGKEGNALIDPSKTHLNVDLIPHHPALNPDDYHKHHRGLGIAEYHKQVTGRTARMHGDKKQLSKAVGCIITLPRDYLKLKYNLTDEEYIAIERYVESGSHKKPKSKAFMSAMEKISQYSFNENELRLIIEFLSSAFRQWQKNAGIRDEDILFAKIHFDETWPHIHIMALPTVEKEVINIETGEAETMITYSTSKFNNAQTHYFDRLHENIIRGMLIEDGIDASGLLNGATKGKGYTPADFNHNQREEGVEIASVNRTMADRRKKLTEDNDELEAKKTELSTDISRLQVLQAEMEEEFNEKKQKCKNYL